MTRKALASLLTKHGLKADYKTLMQVMGVSKRTAHYWLSGDIEIPPNQLKLLRLILETRAPL